jgi:hypothetical protein
MKYFNVNARNERYEIIVSFPLMPLVIKYEYLFQVISITQHQKMHLLWSL